MQNTRSRNNSQSSKLIYCRGYKYLKKKNSRGIKSYKHCLCTFDWNRLKQIRAIQMRSTIIINKTQFESIICLCAGLKMQICHAI